MDYKETILAHRKQWLDALRSGELPQGTGTLCEVNTDSEPVGYCCLGVAEHISGNTWSVHTESGRRQYGLSGADAYLSMETRDWLGFKVQDPTLDWPDDHEYAHYTVADLNDKMESFKQIADYIEQYGFVARDDVLAES